MEEIFTPVRTRVQTWLGKWLGSFIVHCFAVYLELDGGKKRRSGW